MLIAHLKVHLKTGDTVELLPVQHKSDIHTEVSELLKSWASSGFLIREKFAYPWHQVLRIEVAIEKLTRNEASQQLLSSTGSDHTHLHEDFWRGEHRL